MKLKELQQKPKDHRLSPADTGEQCSPESRKERTDAQDETQTAMVSLVLVLPFLEPEPSTPATPCHAPFAPAEDHTLTIQPLSLGSADEKLGTSCVRCSICPRQDARTRASG